MHFKLWKSLFSYNGEFPGSLSFNVNELFLVIRKENEYWFLVSEIDGTLGCVPINYLEETHISDEKIFRYVNNAVKSLSERSASVISKRDDLIRELLEFRESSNKKGEKAKVSKPNEHTQPTQPPNEPSLIPEGLAFTLTDTIRQSTLASHQCSIHTLQSILTVLGAAVPDLTMWTNAVEAQLMNSEEFNVDSIFHKSLDWKNMQHLFNYFQQRKNDSQERSWSLHEDVNDLRKKLTKLLKILKAANSNLIVSFLETSNHDSFQSLLEWYQMEQRSVLRQLLLQIFVVCCEVNRRTVDICLQSILPLELVRDLLDHHTNCKNFTFATLLFNLLMCPANNINVDIRDKLNEELCTHLLQKLSEYHHTVLRTSHGGYDSLGDGRTSHESDDEEDEDDEDELSCRDRNGSVSGSSFSPQRRQPRLYMDDVIFGCLLTLNRRFPDVRSNPVLACLQARPELTQLFVEKLIRAFNRNHDPSSLSMFIRGEHSGRSRALTASSNGSSGNEVNSVRKILCDVYSSPGLAEIVYRNDADVIIDIIARELCDLPPTSPALAEYLVLLDLIITNSEYGRAASKHKLSDLRQAIVVLQTGGDTSELDQELAASIAAKLQLLS